MPARRVLKMMGARGYPVLPSIYLRVAQACRRAGNVSGGLQIIEVARAQYPGTLALDVEWAELATAAHDWDNAATRWRCVLDALSDRAPIAAYARLSQALRYQERFDDALGVVNRGLTLHPDELRLAIEQAEIAVAAKDWRTAYERWSNILERFCDDAPPTAYIRLSQASRYLGDRDAAEHYVERGLSRFPEYLKVAIEHAEVAMANGDWKAAASRLELLLAAHGRQVPAAVYARLSHAYRRQGEFVEAERCIERGRSRYPDETCLLHEHAEIATAQRKWGTALARWEQLLERRGDAAAAVVFVRLVQLHRRRRDFTAAEALCARGIERHPTDVSLIIEHAENATAERNWPVVMERWSRVFERAGEGAPPRAFVRLAHAHRVLADAAAADETVQRGLALYPTDPTLAVEHAEIAMVRRDWAAALERWQAALGGADSRSAALPSQSALLDWHECDWHLLAAHWLAQPNETRESRSPELYQRVAALVAGLGYHDEADALLRRGRTRYPHNLSLAITHAESATARREWRRAIERWQALVDERGLELPARVFEALCLAFHTVGDDESAAEVCQLARSRYPHLAGLAGELAENRGVLASFANPRLRTRDVPLHLIRHHPGTMLSEQLRSGVYITRDHITERLDDISDRLGAIRTSGGFRLIKRMGGIMARRYGARYQRPPHLPAEVLADAIHFHVVTELATLVPIRHLARCIAAEHSGEPICVDLPRAELSCLKYWAANDLEPLLLYVELKRLGANAFLCLQDHSDSSIDAAKATQLRFFLNGSWERTAALPVERGRRSHSALIPAGVRGLDRVVTELSGSHVFPSAHIINPLPYSLRYVPPKVDFTETIYPEPLTVDEIVIPFEPGPMLASRCHNGSQIRARVETAAGVDLDLMAGLDRLIGDLVHRMAKAAADRVERHGIDDLHVCDHLFLESVIMEHAVKRAGGRVTLWPHSTNPVDRTARKPSQVDAVVAITHTGLSMWREALPGVPVRLESDLMLPPPATPPAPVENAPLTVVVIGGGSLMGRLPAVSPAAHRESYRRLLHALSGLGDAVDIVFKPKGAWLETATWLHRVVDGRIGFRVTSDHPLMIDYPNMLFVSVSFGSSALLEGISRGIPGLIVRDFEVEDYTTIDTRVIKAGTTTEIIEEIRGCLDPAYRQRVIELQMAYYRLETGYDSSNAGLQGARAIGPRAMSPPLIMSGPTISRGAASGGNSRS